MAALTYSASAGGWVVDGTTGPTVTPTGNDDLTVTSGSNVEISANLQFNSLTIGTSYGIPGNVTVDEGVTVTGNVTVFPGSNLQLGNNKTSPNANNPAVVNGQLTIQTAGIGFFGGIAANQVGSVNVYSGTLNGAVNGAGDLYDRGTATLASTDFEKRNVFGGPGSVLKLDSSLQGAELKSILASLEQNGFDPSRGGGTVQVSGNVNNTGSTINLTQPGSPQLDNATVSGGTILSGANSVISGCSLDNVTIQGVCTIPQGSYDFCTGSLDGSGTVNVASSSLGFGTCTTDPITINLSGLLYGEFGQGAVTVTLGAGTVINISKGGFIAFDSRYNNSMVLQGELNVLGAASAYSSSLTNTAGTVQFASGAAVTIGNHATLITNTMLDNETKVQLAGGMFEVDQAPSTLGTIQFFAPSSTLKIGDGHSTAFAVTGTLLDFSNTDQVVFANTSYGASAHVTLTGNTLQVFDQGGSLDATFTLLRDDAQTYSKSSFALGSSASGMVLTATSGITPLVVPTITAGATASFTGGGSPVALDPGLSLADSGSATLVGATVSIGTAITGDTLNFTNQGGITGSFNATTGVLTLSGTASVSAYQSALQSITYGFPAQGDPSAGGGLTSRQISWVVNDGSVTSLAASSTLNTADASPVVTAGATVSYSLGGIPVVADTAITVSDSNSLTLSGATVSIAGGSFTGNSELLNTDTTGTAITAFFNPLNDILFLSGTDTIADYQKVLSFVTYVDTGSNPTNNGSNTNRTLTWTVTNGVTSSAPVTSTINVQPTRAMLWTGAGSADLATAQNWNDATDGLNPATSAPGSADVAEFTSGGGSLSGTGTAAKLWFGGDTGWTVSAGGQLSAATGAVVGVGGSGLLVIHGTVQTGTVATGDPQQGFDIAQAAASSGQVVVSGTGATLGNTGNFIVGDSGFGELTINNAGSVVTAPGSVAGIVGAVVAAQGGADGSEVSVTGNGSHWQIGGALVVGNAGAGGLAISAGGGVTATSVDAGVLAESSGVVSVVGTGSTLSAGSTLIVGDAASAELFVLAGGVVSATNADIGVQAGSSGNVDIEDAGSHLDIANDLHIGDAGVGVLTLGNGTELTVGNNLVVGANGVLNQFGGSIDPSTITIVAGGRQGGHGTSTASVMISNAGTLFASSGTETVITPLITAPSGKFGVLEIDAAGDMALNVTSVDATQSVSFTDGTGILTIGTIAGFAASIVGVNAGDQIIVQGKSIASDSFNASAHTLTLFDGSSATIGTLQLGPSVDGTAILANGTGGLGVAPCFAAGTRISTERGDVAVEDLRVGDRVQVVPLHPHPDPLPLRGRGGGTRPLPRSGEGLPPGAGPGGSGSSQPITWIGHRTVDCTRHPEPHKVHPVRVSAHAFGPNRPARDLYLSPDHALYLNGVLIPVKHLVNATTIVQTFVSTVTYYHVELPAHAILLAENLPAESYLDTGDRTNFANADGPIALHPDFASRQWEATGCAPLVVTGPQLEAARIWIAALALVA